jgi:S1-C subfamily serine protease
VTFRLRRCISATAARHRATDEKRPSDFGAGLQHVRLARRRNAAQPPEREHAILIVNIDPDGPAARAGLVLGDIVTAWNAQPLVRVRDLMRHLGPDSVGNTIDLQVLRGGAPTNVKIVIGERPLA